MSLTKVNAPVGIADKAVAVAVDIAADVVDVPHTEVSGRNRRS